MAQKFLNYPMVSYVIAILTFDLLHFKNQRILCEDEYLCRMSWTICDIFKYMRNFIYTKPKIFLKSQHLKLSFLLELDYVGIIFPSVIKPHELYKKSQFGFENEFHIISN